MKIKIPRSKLCGRGGYSVIVAPITGETYVVPLWMLVPEGTTLQDIEVYEDREPAFKPAKKERIEHIVAGSKGKVYSVIIDYKEGHSCSCPGFAFHGRKCKHINALITK